MTRASYAAAALLLVLAGCSSEEPAPASSPSSVYTEAEHAYLDALRKIDPGLVAKEGRAIWRGENTCLDIKAWDDHTTVVKMTAERFTVDDVTIDEAEAERIVKVAQETICPR